MKRVAIVGLGWLGMPLGLSLQAQGYGVTGSKTTEDGVEAARLCGIAAQKVLLDPELVCDKDSLATLLDVDSLVITLPARRSGGDDRFYFRAVQELVDSALANSVPHIVFTSSSSVYGEVPGWVSEDAPLQPVTASGRVLQQLENWMHSLPGTAVDILRLAGLVGPERHPGRFLANKTEVPAPNSGVNLVHLDDVIAAITLLINTAGGNRTYNLAAPQHPAREVFYTQMAKQLGLTSPTFRRDSDEKPGKQVDGSRICRDLGFEYQYPDPLTMPWRT